MAKGVGYPKWNEPATKGDVLTAMIWSQALINRAFAMGVAAAAQDTASLKIAADRFDAEWEEFNRKVEELGGVVAP